MTSTDVAVVTTTPGELEPLEESPQLNRLLLRNARRTPKEIEQITGIPAAEVAERLEYLLNNPSVRDDLMEEKLILAEIGMIVDDIRDRMSGYVKNDEGYASMARVALAAHKMQLEQLDKRRKELEGRLALVTEREAMLMMAAIRMARELAVTKLRVLFPEADEDVVYEVFEQAFEEALNHIEENSDIA